MPPLLCVVSDASADAVVSGAPVPDPLEAVVSAAPVPDALDAVVSGAPVPDTLEAVVSAAPVPDPLEAVVSDCPLVDDIGPFVGTLFEVVVTEASAVLCVSVELTVP